MSGNGKLRVAIVGAGVGAGHARGIAELGDLYELAVMCDRDTARAEAVAADVPAGRIEDDLDKVLMADDIDVVALCLPPHMHFDALIKGLDSGKAIVGEKPLVTSLAEMDAVEEKVRTTGGKLFPVLQYRFGPGYRKLMHLIETGLAGRALAGTLETHWRREAAYYSVPWRGTWAGECGGVIVSHASHIHDLMAHALGGVRRVAAFLDTRSNAIETEDCGAISFETGSGALVTSSLTLGAAQDMSRMRLCFENVTVESGLEPYTVSQGDWTFTAKSEEMQKKIDAACAAAPEGHSRYAGLYAEIHAAVTGGATSILPDLTAARRSMEMITAIYHAQRSGSVVSLPLSKDHPLYEGWSLDTANATAAD